jgi:hypothetical protein
MVIKSSTLRLFVRSLEINKLRLRKKINLRKTWTFLIDYLIKRESELFTVVKHLIGVAIIKIIKLYE